MVNRRPPGPVRRDGAAPGGVKLIRDEVAVGSSIRYRRVLVARDWVRPAAGVSEHHRAMSQMAPSVTVTAAMTQRRCIKIKKQAVCIK